MFVNDAKIRPLTPSSLKDGDIIQIGIDIEDEDSSMKSQGAYIFKYHSQLPVKRVFKNGRVLLPGDSMFNVAGDAGTYTVLSERLNL